MTNKNSNIIDEMKEGAFGFYAPTVSQLYKEFVERRKRLKKAKKGFPEKIINDFKLLEIKGLLSFDDGEIN